LEYPEGGGKGQKWFGGHPTSATKKYPEKKHPGTNITEPTSTGEPKKNAVAPGNRGGGKHQEHAG